MANQSKSTNITWTEGKITRDHREKLLGQKGATLWFTGLSGSGKSTVAQYLEAMLVSEGVLAFCLDGDNVRHGLNKNLGFSPSDREENIRRIGEVSWLFTQAGVLTLVSFISPYIKDRQAARELMGKKDFIEIYVKCGLETCENRDPKGLYKKARAGEIPEFTGISAPYEAPENPEITIETDKLSVEECGTQIFSYLKENGYLG